MKQSTVYIVIAVAFLFAVLFPGFGMTLVVLAVVRGGWLRAKGH